MSATLAREVAADARGLAEVLARARLSWEVDESLRRFLRSVCAYFESVAEEPPPEPTARAASPAPSGAVLSAMAVAMAAHRDPGLQVTNTGAAALARTALSAIESAGFQVVIAHA